MLSALEGYNKEIRAMQRLEHQYVCGSGGTHAIVPMSVRMPLKCPSTLNCFPTLILCTCPKLILSFAKFSPYKSLCWLCCMFPKVEKLAIVIYFDVGPHLGRRMGSILGWCHHYKLVCHKLLCIAFFSKLKPNARFFVTSTWYQTHNPLHHSFSNHCLFSSLS